MFDFFQDLYFELNGYDMQSIKEQKKEKEEREQAGRFILKRKTKIIIVCFFLPYFLLSGLLFYSAINSQDIYSVVKNLILAITSFMAILLCMFKGKCVEILTLCFIAITILLTFVLPM